MLALLRLVSLRHLGKTPGQTLRSVAAVMLGVGGLVSVHMFNRTLAASFDESVDAAAGRTHLQVTGGDAGIPEDTLDRVREVPGIEAAVPRIESIAYRAGDEGEILTVLGVDITEEGRVRRYKARDDGGEDVIDDPLVFLSRPDSIILTRAYAAAHGLKRDDPIELVTSSGKRTFVVRGLLAPEGPAVAFGGNLAVMDYQAAQVAFAKRGRLDAVDVIAAPGTVVDDLAEQLRTTLGTGLEVARPRQRSADLTTATRSFRLLLNFFSMLTLIVGMFLLYNAVSMSVAQRGREIALMRALGVLRGEAVRLFLLEAALVGAIGSVLGVWFGAVQARFLSGSLAASLNSSLFMHLDTSKSAPIDARVLAIGLVAGVATTLLAAWLPARQATRFAPATAARRGAVIALRQPRLPSPWWGALAVGLAMAVTAIAAQTGISALGPLADLLFILGAALLAPLAIRLVVPLVARLLERLGAIGRLAALNVATTPQRSALTALPLMVAVALVVTLGTVVVSFRRSLVDWVDVLAVMDLQLASVSQEPGRNLLMPASLADGIAEIPGVAQVGRFRIVHAMSEGRRIAITSFDFDPYDPERCCLRFRRGDPDTAFGRIARGEAVAVSQNFADKFGLGVGDTVRVPTSRGLVPLPIAGVHLDYNSDQGTIVMARQRFLDLFGDDRLDFIYVHVAAGLTPEAVRAKIAARFGEPYQLVIFTTADLRQEFIDVVDRAFRPIYPLFVLTVMIGCLGIANSLYVAVTERVREIGVLRSLGSRRREVVRLFVIEATVLGTMGALLGLGLGGLLSYLWVGVHVRYTLGWSIDYHFALVGMLTGVVAALATAPLAGWFPARRAARIPPVVALAHE